MRARFGARTFGMLLCAYLWAWLGFGNLRDVPPARPEVIYLYAPAEIRAAVWMGVALIAACTAWSRRYSIIGLIALTIPPMAVVASYGYALIVHFIPGGGAGYSDAYYTAALFMALPGLVVMAALAANAPRREDK